jgi:hypothetical protein
MWLFVPQHDTMKTFAESAFAPVSADLILDCISQNPDTELFAMSSETLIARPLSWRGWRTRPWLRHLFGTICDPLMANRGVAAFISSLPVIPASPSPTQVSEKEKMTRATSGQKSPGSRPPDWLFFENAPGDLSLGLQDVARDLQEMDYRVAARVVSTAEVGGAHTRERLFILAHADVQGVGEQSVHSRRSRRPSVQDRSESEGHPDRDQECSERLDADVGTDDCGGVGAAGLPLFPPLPGDFAQWGETLRHAPELKPCLHGLDDGLACGVDRSAAAGNGVVPMAAARAYLDLKKELMNTC